MPFADVVKCNRMPINSTHLLFAILIISSKLFTDSPNSFSVNMYIYSIHTRGNVRRNEIKLELVWVFVRHFMNLILLFLFIAK